jgi:hypothetical protein
MKKVLLLMLMASVLMVANAAMADFIGIYDDDAGSSCIIGAGHNPFVIHKFSLGTTGSRWKIDVSAAPGTGILFFNPLIGVPVGNALTDITVGYGACLTGTVVVGQAFLSSPGVGPITVRTADGQIMIVNIGCDFGEYAATGGTAYLGGAQGPCDVATQPSTWGQVKALYR